MFDRFAEWCSEWTGRAPYFAACIIISIVGVPIAWCIGKLELWMLSWTYILTCTTQTQTILLQNTANRREPALQQKADEIIRAIPEACDDVAGIEKKQAS